jgi:two-component system NtrC family response regulator
MDPTTKIVVITGNEGRENALKAIKCGAYDYFRKPVVIGELEVILKRAFYLTAIERENSRLLTNLNLEDLNLSGIIGQSQRMQEVFATIRKVATSDVPILITGESGTGKELVAKAIHGHSLRKVRPFIPINCGAIPENLLESELFGFEKGAFSGADSQKQGMFELANHGTLFLDEIGELNLKSQSKLLRVLDGCPYFRLGGTRKIAVDVRIVAATNADLENEVRLGKFRSDLYHRLNQVSVAVPALRERPDDIAPLAGLFLEQQNPKLCLSDEAMEALECYAWPGNVRELRSLIARVAIMANGAEIRREDLPPEFHPVAQASDASPSHSLDKLEQEVIFHALEQAEGRRNRAAEMLGISRRTLIRRLKLYGINPARPLVCGGTGVN